tara:strand:- start:2884 stop:3210 length:327 start_codon:yes stop_codon:yes gene_type:complete
MITALSFRTFLATKYSSCSFYVVFFISNFAAAIVMGALIGAIGLYVIHNCSSPYSQVKISPSRLAPYHAYLQTIVGISEIALIWAGINITKKYEGYVFEHERKRSLFW